MSAPKPRCGLLHLDGWEGRTQQRIIVVAETTRRYRIRVEATIRLPGRKRHLYPGDTALYAVTLRRGEREGKQMSAPTPCRELTCAGLIAWLAGKVNPKTGKPANVPVDWDSLSNDEKSLYEAGARFEYDKSAGHRSHYETCTKPQRFAKGGKSDA